MHVKSYCGEFRKSGIVRKYAFKLDKGGFRDWNETDSHMKLFAEFENNL